MSVAGSYAYVADDDRGLQILDISNPAAPTLAGSYDTRGYAYGVSVVGNYAYVADGVSGLQILNISNPAAPTLVGTYDTTGYCLCRERGGQLRLCGGRRSAACRSSTSATLPPRPCVGTCDTSGYAYGVSVAGNYAYVADGYSGLQILNISNPAAPTLVGSYDTSRVCLWRERGGQLCLCGGRRQRPADHRHQQPRRPDTGRQRITPPAMPMA